MMSGHVLRVAALDSWRGVCALVVACYHFPVVGLVKSTLVVTNGFLFVDFFFVLSGYVIARGFETKLKDAGSIWRFMVRRFGRLWPLHVAVLAYFVAGALAADKFGKGQYTVSSLWANLFLAHGLGFTQYMNWNIPSWSISVEWALYLMFALLALASWRHWAFVALIAVSVAVLAFIAPHGMDSSYDFGLFRGMAGFFTGALVSRLKPRRFGTLAELAAVAGALAFVSFTTGRGQVFSPFVFAVTVYVFAGSGGLLHRLLNTAPLRAAGTWSYSIYMIHGAVISLFYKITGHIGLTWAGDKLVVGAVPADVYLLGFVAALLAGSAVTYWLIERPATNYFRRISEPSARLAGAVVTAKPRPLATGPPD